VTGEGFKFRDYYAATDREVKSSVWDRDLRFLRGLSPSVPTQAIANQQTLLRDVTRDVRSALESGSL